MPDIQDEPLTWKTSTYTDTGSCVEWARPTEGVLVRDTKCRKRARMAVARPAWTGFVDWAKTATV